MTLMFGTSLTPFIQTASDLRLDSTNHCNRYNGDTEKQGYVMSLSTHAWPCNVTSLIDVSNGSGYEVVFLRDQRYLSLSLFDLHFRLPRFRGGSGFESSDKEPDPGTQ